MPQWLQSSFKNSYSQNLIYLNQIKNDDVSHYLIFFVNQWTGDITQLVNKWTSEHVHQWIIYLKTTMGKEGKKEKHMDTFFFIT